MRIVFNFRNLNKNNIGSIVIFMVVISMVYIPMLISTRNTNPFIFFQTMFKIVGIGIICCLVVEMLKGFRIFSKKQYLEYKLEKEDIENRKELAILNVQEKVEKILDGKVSEYVYSKRYIEKNFATVLTLSVLSIKVKTDKQLESKIRKFTYYMKRFCNKDFYNIDLYSLEKIVSKFNDIFEYKYK